jgi:acyl-[acyl carrier protein]--UDP-N-acetylglucosamine O-acyltransferase
MTDRTASRTELAPNCGVKSVVLVSGTTMTGGSDTLTLTLADFGISKVLAVHGFVHTTEDSVIVVDSGTTAVSNGVLTYTTGAGNNSKKRVVEVIGV